MGSLQADSEEKQEMDDSGCVQDEAPTKRCENGFQGVQLLDLSDDVLLLILRFLTPRDLKALGYTCPRLGALILDRSLWQRVDARAQPWTRARLRWYLAHALHAGTRELLLAGYAREARECLGHVNQTREELEAARLLSGEPEGAREEDNNNSEPPDDEQSDSQSGHSDRSQSPRIIEVPALGPNAQLLIDEAREESPEAWAWPRASDPLISDSTCPGPQFTLTQCVLRQLADTCPALASLGLEYCNINCNTTSISQFPATLKKLSLRGSKCYNLPLDRSFLFKIQDTLTDLETLDVSECEWMEPASLLPLSKLPALKHLYARDCLRLTEFVAYASLATRYGFTKLQSLDLRGSPVGDSEVSALGWLPRLTHLWLSPARPAPQPPQHSHHKRDSLPSPRTPPRDKWEAQEPEYFKLKEPLDVPAASSQGANKHTWQANLGIDKNSDGKNNATQSAQASSPPKDAHTAPTPSRTPSSSNAPSSSKTPSPSRTPRSSEAPSSSRAPSSSNAPSSSKAPSPSKAPKRKTSSPSPGPSKRRRDSSSNDDDDDDLPLKCLIKKQNVNEGASTSRNEPQRVEAPAQAPDREAEPRHHVLYVNVGQQVHAVYRLSLDNEHIVSFSRNSSRRVNTRNIFLSPPGTHLDASALVTDSAIRRFGRADGEDINYVHIGPNGPYAAAALPGARPDRSSLTHLSVTGFRHITDRSLEHLATSAPHLRFLDFSETSVTEDGVNSFRSLRPECEVRHSQYVDKKD